MKAPLDDVWDERFRRDRAADDAVERRLLFKAIGIATITALLGLLRELLT